MDRDARPLPGGTRCENPDYCEGEVDTVSSDANGTAIKTTQTHALLNEEERSAPAKCVFCKRFLCDYCVFGVQIPAEVFNERGQGRKPNDVYDEFVCSEHFKEEWV